MKLKTESGGVVSPPLQYFGGCYRTVCEANLHCRLYFKYIEKKFRNKVKQKQDLQFKQNMKDI